MEQECKGDKYVREPSLHSGPSQQFQGPLGKQAQGPSNLIFRALAPAAAFAEELISHIKHFRRKIHFPMNSRGVKVNFWD